MAHNIATINGKSAMAYDGQTPWHKLGTRTPGMDVDRALTAAQLRWQVELQQIKLPDGTFLENFRAAVRIDANGKPIPLAVHGLTYKVIQNETASNIARPLVSDFGCTVETAGALGNGERCWMLIKLPNATVTPVPGDDVRGYALLTWSHDGQTNLSMLGTGVRVVCQNTLSMALSAARGNKWIAIRHTASADKRLDEAAAIVRQLTQAMRETGDTFAALARTIVSPEQLRAYIASVIPNTTSGDKVSDTIVRRRQTIETLAFSGKGSDLANQYAPAGSVSVWSAYNAVTEYFDHVRMAEAVNASGVARAAESAIFGGNAQVKVDALQAARQLLSA